MWVCPRCIYPRLSPQILVNGQLLLAERELQHLDRVILAPNHLYIYFGVPAQRKPGEQVCSFWRTGVHATIHRG